MAVKLRLMRVGKKKQPTYRVVVADGRSPRDGRYIEIIGRYAPRHEPSLVEIDDDKTLEWLRKGAQPTEPVEKLLRDSGLWERYQTERGRPVGVSKKVEKNAEQKPSKKARARAGAAESAPTPEAAAKTATVEEPPSGETVEPAAPTAGSSEETAPEAAAAAEEAGE